MGFAKGERVRIIGGRLIGIVQDTKVVPEGYVYILQLEHSDIIMEMPPDMVGAPDAPVHWYIHQFIELAKKKRKSILLVGKEKKKAFVRIIASTYEELQVKKKQISRRNKNINWKWLMEIKLEETPAYIDPPSKPPKNWFLQSPDKPKGKPHPPSNPRREARERASQLSRKSRDSSK